MPHVRITDQLLFLSRRLIAQTPNFVWSRSYSYVIRRLQARADIQED